MKTSSISRRGFLKGALGAGAALGVPAIVPSTVFGAGAPSNRVTTGHIGVGGRGGGLLGEAAGHPNVQVVGICDCFKERREGNAANLNSRYGGNVCQPYRDLREMLARDDIDAVVVATPDHWHVPAALMAVRSGKDVYVEKPLGLSMEQDIAIRQAVLKYGRIFQYGTQQRSMAHVRFGCELVRNGRVGKLLSVDVVAPGGSGGGSTTPIPVPENLDYDMWLGPAPWSPYTKDRCTSSGTYFVSDNCLGFIGGWGAHPLDVMAWGLGDEADAVPVEYEGKGVFPTDGLFDCCTTWDVRGKFSDGKDFHFTAGGDLTVFTGEKGKVFISRGGLKTEPASLMKDKIGPEEIHLFESKYHMGNFVECVRTRRKAVSHVEAAVCSDTVTQISLIACLTGRKIKWDNKKEVIVGDPGASQLLTRAMRSPWHL
ncbi:MAG: Gfo/Idh/MocA family oxidoreductase [Planctomycetota bacterium]|nr:Gfo/Idh/MocA family oxidoreductase [Planctomycetota bacterium]